MIWGVNHLSMTMLTLHFEIVPETLVSDTGGVNHLLMPKLTLSLKIVPETLVSDTGGSRSSLDMGR